VDAIGGAATAEPSFRQALHVQKIIDAIQESYRARTWVSVG
jgi:predicted dehydrogenase